MSPVQIEVLLRFYYDPCAQEFFRDKIGHQKAIREFLALGLLKTTNCGDIIADQEAVTLYVEALMAVPLPIQGWRMPS